MTKRYMQPGMQVTIYFEAIHATLGPTATLADMQIPIEWHVSQINHVANDASDAMLIFENREWTYRYQVFIEEYTGKLYYDDEQNLAW